MVAEKQEGQEQTPEKTGAAGAQETTPEVKNQTGAAGAQSAEKQADGEVKKAHFSSLTAEKKDSAPTNIKFLMDISLALSIELGRAVLNVKEILSLRNGSVVELNKLAGDPVDIFVNNKLIARGEVVVIDDNFGVRVTDILSPAELINNLKNETGDKKQ